MDDVTMARHLRRVARCLSNGGWWTLRKLAAKCGILETSASARIRELRSRGWTIDKVRMPNNLWYYKGTP